MISISEDIRNYIIWGVVAALFVGLMGHVKKEFDKTEEKRIEKAQQPVYTETRPRKQEKQQSYYDRVSGRYAEEEVDIDEAIR